MEMPKDLHVAKAECPNAGRAEAVSASVCLVTALTVEDFVDPELTADSQHRSPQLGVMTIAAILREKDFSLEILNLDDLYLKFIRGGNVVSSDESTDAADRKSPNFLSYVVEHLQHLSCDVYGLSTICSSYPLTLRLAEEIKRINPNAPLILGGPQASVVDVATMRAFSCVDFVVRGEADDTFPALLDVLFGRCSQNWEEIPGVTFRRGGKIIRNDNASVVPDLDRLPLPAFDLDPDIKNRACGIHIEIGRGCPFACSFCSTNDFFRRNFRLKSSAKMIEHMNLLNEKHGITYFSLVHDMYTINRKKVVEFCNSLLECKAKFTWGCSARTDCIDDELLSLMANAGCRGIFFGIETGSKRLQHVINKKLDLDEARKRIECASRCGIKMAVALIMGFPDETRDDLRDTVNFFIDSLRYDHAEPQISLLAPLAATPIQEQYKDKLIFDQIFSDMSHQGWRQDEIEVKMIQAHPEIFPNFYAVPTKWLDRSHLKELRDFLIYIATWFRWLPVALLQDSGDFLKVFDRWRTWLTQRKHCESKGTSEAVLYYAQRKFRDEFLEFVQECYVEEMCSARAAIDILSRVEGVSGSSLRGYESNPAKRVEAFDAACVPFLRENLCLLDIDLDYKELIERLRNQSDLGAAPERKGTIALLPTRQKEMQVWQLTPASVLLLRLCDGKRSVGEITGEWRRSGNKSEGISAEVVVFFGLMQLRKEGFIEIASCAVAAEGASEREEKMALWSPAIPQFGGTQQPWPPLTAAERLPAAE